MTMDQASSLCALSRPPSEAMIAALEAIKAFTNSKNDVTNRLSGIQIKYRRPGRSTLYQSHVHTVLIALPANDN